MGKLLKDLVGLAMALVAAWWWLILLIWASLVHILWVEDHRMISRALFQLMAVHLDGLSEPRAWVAAWREIYPQDWDNQYGWVGVELSGGEVLVYAAGVRPDGQLHHYTSEQYRAMERRHESHRQPLDELPPAQNWLVQAELERQLEEAL